MKSIFVILSIVIFLFHSSSAQQQVKIMSYNLLGYPADSSIRVPYFRTIINAVNPDILVVCEITSRPAVNSFLKSIMNFNSVTYDSGRYIDGYDTDNAIFYNKEKFNFISNTPIKTSLRDISEFKITDKIYHDTLRIFMVHLKANLADSLLRAAEVDSLRKFTNNLPSGTNFIIAGDFNLYSANESAYKKLIKNNPADDGNFIDPLTMTGVWNNAAYSINHTQSTRTRSFGNGATGGLDDRFDMILNSNAVKNPGGIKFIPGTYTAYGNDGNHYNDSINKIPNSAVTQTIANALHYASDHLPVYASYEFGNPVILNVKLISEGMYIPASDKLSRKDTVIAYLRNVNAPFQIIDSAFSLNDTLNFNSSLYFRNTQTGNYFLTVKTFNTIETWSSSGIHYNTDSIMNYDFTVSNANAYGNNEVFRAARYCIYSGDINNDGFVNLEDILTTSNAANNFSAGYFKEDVNGNNLVELNDILTVYNNAGKFISKVTP